MCTCVLASSVLKETQPLFVKAAAIKSNTDVRAQTYFRSYALDLDVTHDLVKG